MSADLKRRKLLAPWPLQFDVFGRAVTVDGLQVVQPDAYDTAAVKRFVKTFGATGAMFLGAHRLSLFRAGVLLERARSALRPAASAPA
jgi:hypothetical protein